MTKKEEAWFSNTNEGKGVNYSYVRSLNISNNKDLSELIVLLKNRLQAILIDQTEILNSIDGKIYTGASFPLAVMTCIGVETLGRILFEKNKNDASHQFVEGIKLVDQRFGRKLKKTDKKHLIEIWGTSFEDANVKTIGSLVHSYFRNTMFHGYRGKGVFLSFQQKELMKLEEGWLVINPNTFWRNFVFSFDKEFEILMESKTINQSNKKVVAIQKYLNELINK